jgi:hypothetical protein
LKDTKGWEQYVACIAKYMEEHRVLQQLMEVSAAAQTDVEKIEELVTTSQEQWLTPSKGYAKYVRPHSARKSSRCAYRGSFTNYTSPNMLTTFIYTANLLI